MKAYPLRKAEDDGVQKADLSGIILNQQTMETYITKN
jgi:hypothetical protein